MPSSKLELLERLKTNHLMLFLDVVCKISNCEPLSIVRTILRLSLLYQPVWEIYKMHHCAVWRAARHRSCRESASFAREKAKI